MKIPIDYTCTGWIDSFLGISFNDCCVAHDLGGTDLELMQCVSLKHPWFIIMGVIMFVGVKLGRPVYRAVLNMRNKHE